VWIINPVRAQISQVLPSGAACTPGVATTAGFEVQDDSGVVIRVVLRWSGFATGSAVMTRQGTLFFGSAGPVPFPGKDNNGGALNVTAVAFDASGQQFVLDGGGPVNVLKCSQPPIIIVP
jgi:putative peptide zinc metalloprotease protein